MHSPVYASPDIPYTKPHDNSLELADVFLFEEFKQHLVHWKQYAATSQRTPSQQVQW